MDVKEKNEESWVVNIDVDPVEEIRIKYLADIKPIQPAHAREWVDLRAAEDIYLKKGEFKLIPLGIAMELPEGYEALVAPRSSTFKNFHIIQTNGVGVVDNQYCGDDDQWFMPVLAIEDTAIQKNDRVCQFRIQKSNPIISFITTDHLNYENRGGHGSTGIQ